MKYCLIGILAAVPLVAAAQDAAALNLVRRAMERDTRTTYTCIRILNNWDSTDPLRVRRDQAASGANRILVLAPIRQQGTTIVDNGQQWVTYNPDQGLLTIRDSPLAQVSPNDIARRFDLLRRNYTVTRIGPAQVAGRNAVHVRLEPQPSAPAFRRAYWIDSDKSVLLRVEWTSPSGQRKMMSDTISISYPASLPEGTFDVKFSSVGAPREIRIQAPKRYQCICALSRAVGFSVVNPIQMPHGFLFTSADAVRAGNRTMAALRYTDGATNATVYQASARNNAEPPWKSDPGRATAKVDEVWVSVDGDLPPEGKRALLRAVSTSSSRSEIEARTRVAADLKVPEKLIKELRDTGLGFEEVIASVVAGKGDGRASAAASRALLSGRGVSELPLGSGVSESAIRSAVSRFRSPGR